MFTVKVVVSYFSGKPRKDETKSNFSVWDILLLQVRIVLSGLSLKYQKTEANVNRIPFHPGLPSVSCFHLPMDSTRFYLMVGSHFSKPHCIDL